MKLDGSLGRGLTTKQSPLSLPEGLPAVSRAPGRVPERPDVVVEVTSVGEDRGPAGRGGGDRDAEIRLIDQAGVRAVKVRDDEKIMRLTGGPVTVEHREIGLAADRQPVGASPRPVSETGDDDDLGVGAAGRPGLQDCFRLVDGVVCDDDEPGLFEARGEP